MNVILIGMPSCGKSTIGVLLAKTLGISFVDTDIIIQKKAGATLQSIIDKQGLGEFLRIEEEVLCELSEKDTVIATGGSAVYSRKAMEHLKKNGKVVYIRIPLCEIERRLVNIKSRGVALQSGATISDLFKERTPLYEKFADYTIDTEGLTLEEAVEKIAKIFETR